MRTIVCGDGITSMADEKQLKWPHNGLTKQYELKLQATLGPDACNGKHARILNRLVTRDDARLA